MVPYSHELECVAASGQANCVTLPAPIRGILTRLIVRQADGDLDGFEFDIYDREDACTGVESSQNPDDGVDLQSAEIHKLIETQTVAAAASVAALYERVIAYENRDERIEPAIRRTGAIYLSLTPTGTGNKTFQVAYTITGPLFH